MGRHSYIVTPVGGDQWLYLKCAKSNTWQFQNSTSKAGRYDISLNGDTFHTTNDDESTEHTFHIIYSTKNISMRDTSHLIIH